MASQVDICNLCLSILGKPPIGALSDPSTAARVLSIEYDLIRKGLINGPPKWCFSRKRTSLAAAAGAPASGPFTTWYTLPSDYIALLQVGDMWPGLDLSDYRLGPIDSDYSVEGGMLLCDYGSPLSLSYVADITDTGLFDPNFVIYFASELAWSSCERLTGSNEKQAAALDRKNRALANAAASNALLKPPDQRAEDTWIAARMQ